MSHGKGVATVVSNKTDMGEKWGEEVAKRGFAQSPNYLLFINQFLDEDNRLSPLELLLLIQISAAWWRKTEMPFPSVRTLASRCGASERQVLRALAALEGAGFVKRVKRREKGLIAANAYDLSPLVEKLESVAEVFPNAFPRNIR